MPVYASRQSNTGTTLNIDGMRDGLKMGRIDAIPNMAQMIDFFVLGDWPYQDHVRCTMRSHNLACKKAYAVSFFRNLPAPKPAGFSLVNVLPKSPIESQCGTVFVKTYSVAVLRSGRCGTESFSTLQTVFRFVHVSPPRDIQVDSGEVNLGVIDVQDGFEVRLYPHRKCITRELEN
jgi:hypothetical protein